MMLLISSVIYFVAAGSLANIMQLVQRGVVAIGN
jgi:hypothetical protein